MDQEFDLEIQALLAGLEKLALAIGKPMGELIRRNGRLICVNLALQTQPFGADKRGKEEGERAIARDIRIVYADAGKAYDWLKKVKQSGNQTGEQVARAFYKAVSSGNIDRAKRILLHSGIPEKGIRLEDFDGGEAHRRRRNSRGRIGGGRSPSMVVLDRKKLDRYQAKLKRNVGIAKSGWAEPARMLGGTRGIPQWVTRHKGNGFVEDHSAAVNYPRVRVVNSVPWIKKVLTDRQATEAVLVQRQKMLKHVEKVITASARRVGIQAA